MLSRLSRTILDHALCRAGDRVLLAVSGGPDSTALLWGLSILAPRLSISLFVASVDHGLRPEAAEEARGVIARAKSLGIDGTVLRVDVSAARRAHRSLQESAREARLSALSSYARETGCASVALGHTADDQAETVLFRIIRGTGVAGLAGIPYHRDSFIRPLLDVRRGDILAFLNKRKIPYLSDPSNANRRFTRARIRHDILPFLSNENPKITEALLALARSVAEPVAVFPGLPGGTLVSRGARAVIARVHGQGRGTKQVAVPGGVVECSYGDLRFLSKGSPGSANMDTREVSIPVLGRFSFPNGVGLSLCPVPPGTPNAFDADRLCWPLTLRAPRSGDRMRPRGGTGRRKLSDLFIDSKIPRGQRASLPVLCDGSGEILYVPRSRPSELGRPTHMSTKLFVVEEAR